MRSESRNSRKNGMLSSDPLYADCGIRVEQLRNRCESLDPARLTDMLGSAAPHSLPPVQRARDDPPATPFVYPTHRHSSRRHWIAWTRDEPLQGFRQAAIGENVHLHFSERRLVANRQLRFEARLPR